MTRYMKKSESLNLFPDRLFYKIGEVSKILEIESYVLRYWESEFTFLRPKRSQSGQRIYTKQDIELLLTIKKLLYDEKYTIDGVRRKLQRSNIPLDKPLDSNHAFSKGTSETDQTLEPKVQELLAHIKNRLLDISKSL